MSEIEKLRALLAEAREIARSVRNAGSLPYAQWSRDQHEADSVVDRIDAALAEPVSPVWSENARLDTMWQQLVRERDEARDVAERNARDCAHLRQSAITLERERDEAVAAFHEATRLRSGIQQARIKAEDERDEARAEVERLQAELVRVARAEFDRGVRQGVDQALWASRTAQETAYQRGAEAMREAAASCVGSDTVLLQTYRSVLEGRIRDLPVPEDKP